MPEENSPEDPSTVSLHTIAARPTVYNTQFSFLPTIMREIESQEMFIFTSIRADNNRGGPEAYKDICLQRAAELYGRLISSRRSATASPGKSHRRTFTVRSGHRKMNVSAVYMGITMELLCVP